MRVVVHRDEAASNAQYDFVRFMIIRDQDSDGVAPIVAGLGGVLDQNDVLSPLNRTESTHYRVLYDKMFVLKDGAQSSWARKKFLRLSGRTTFSGAGGTVTDAVANHYYYVCFTTVGAVNTPKITLQTRMNYKDA